MTTILLFSTLTFGEEISKYLVLPARGITFTSLKENNSKIPIPISQKETYAIGLSGTIVIVYGLSYMRQSVGG